MQWDMGDGGGRGRLRSATALRRSVGRRRLHAVRGLINRPPWAGGPRGLRWARARASSGRWLP